MEELQQLFYLDKLIQNELTRLEALREAADIKSPALTTMPRAPGAKDKLGDIVPQIADLEQEIEENIRIYAETRDRLLKYINRVPNARIKLIMILRFIEQRPWEEVADVVGGKETGDSARMCVTRYLAMEESYSGG